MKDQTTSSEMIQSMSLEELKKMSVSDGEIENLTPGEEKERWEAIYEMTTIKKNVQ